MQAFSDQECNRPYISDMPAGRPSKAPRSDFGERLWSIRTEKGLSQKHVADRLGITQQSYALWERRSVAVKPEQLTQLAEILETSVDRLVGADNGGPRRGGPTGKAHRIFEEVSRLPRHQQQRILSVVEDLLAAHRVHRGVLS